MLFSLHCLTCCNQVMFGPRTVKRSAVFSVSKWSLILTCNYEHADIVLCGKDLKSLLEMHIVCNFGYKEYMYMYFKMCLM